LHRNKENESENDYRKDNLHRNLDKFGYDFEQLIIKSPELKLCRCKNQIETINFSNPDAVKALNKALLLYHYNIKNGIS
jgi:23S rRNA (adenine1618-N6)-methyltransferase